MLKDPVKSLTISIGEATGILNLNLRYLYLHSQYNIAPNSLAKSTRV